MKKVIFATGNKGKVHSMRRHLKRANVDIKLVQKALNLLEPQAETATEVAKTKARQAYQQLGCPVLVDDSSFHIAALGGFPGAFIKYMLTTIGISGIMEFMQGKTDRSAYFLSSLVYIDEQGDEYIFEDEPYHGVITEEIDDYDSETSWSELYKIFIPKGSNKVLARMTDTDKAEIDKKQGHSSYEEFCLWIKARLM